MFIRINFKKYSPLKWLLYVISKTMRSSFSDNASHSKELIPDKLNPSFDSNSRFSISKAPLITKTKTPFELFFTE